jgi:choline kinase
MGRASNHGLMSLVHILSRLLRFPLLRSRQYKSESFHCKLLDCLRTLQVPVWSTAAIESGDITVYKVSGSLTNAVFFVSCPISLRGARTLLLRIYGPSSGSLISRPKELHTLHVLSSQYRIGPRVYGTFENGRVEEYFESTTLTPADIRDPTISRWIGARMAELHCVDIDVVAGGSSALANRKPKEWDIEVINNIKAWLTPAEDVLKLSVISDAIRARIDLKAFKDEWNRYLQWLSHADDAKHSSRRVFAHNDAQYGNLLRLQQSKVVDEHCQVRYHYVATISYH